MSFVLGELKCTYSEYFNMTWAEFQIRLFSFKRVQNSEWGKISEIARHIIWSDIPKNKKSLDKVRKGYTEKNKSNSTLNEAQRNAILKAQLDYNNRNK